METNKKNKVLLVEDEPTTIKMMTRSLEKGGWEVDVAETANEAIDKINNSNGEYNLLILDENLKDASLGSQMIVDPELDKSKLENTLVVCNSAQAENRDIQAKACFESGLNCYNSPEQAEIKPMTRNKGDKLLDKLFDPNTLGEHASKAFLGELEKNNRSVGIDSIER